MSMPKSQKQQKDRRRSIPAVLMAICIVSATVMGTGPAYADEGIVKLYSYRQSFLMQPLIDAFTAKTGIEVKAVYAKRGILQRLKAEGINSPADLVLAADITRIDELAREGLLRSVSSTLLNENVPAQFRHPDGLWYGLTSRARVIYAHKQRVAPGEITTYEELADPRFKGRICTRSGKNEYNISLLASVINALGPEQSEIWLKGFKDNLARRPQGNDRAQVRAIYEGECDISIGNSYYFGKMATNEEKPEQKDWAAAVNIIFPNQPGSGRDENSPLARGAHVNISTAALTKSSPHPVAAMKLLEYLTSDEAQRIYASQNMEYPVKSGVPVHPLVASWGDFKSDTQRLSDIAALHIEASKMMDRVRFDH